MPTIAVHISGSDVSQYVDGASLATQLRMNARGTSNFVMRDSTRPAVGAPVGIYEDGGLFWGGIIARIGEQAQLDCPDVGIELSIDVVSWEALLDDCIIEVEVYESTNAGAVVSDLITKYFAAYGFSAGTIQAGATITKLVIDHRSGSSVLDELAKLSDFVWLSDQLKRLDFRAATVTAAPYSITDANPHVSHISVTRDSTDYSNEVWRRVNWAAFGTTDETFHGDGAARTWTLDHFPAQVDAITLNGADVTFGRSGVDTGKQYYWSEGSKTITQDDGETLLVLADDLVVKYRELGSDCIYSWDDAQIAARAAVEGTSGHHGRVVDDTANTDANAALATNEAQLASLKVVPRIVEFTATDVFPRPGELVTSNLSTPQIAGQFVVQEVNARYNGNGFLYTATATDVSRYGGWQEWLRSLSGGGGGSVTVTSSGGSSTPSEVTAPDNISISSVEWDTTDPEKARLRLIWTTETLDRGYPTRLRLLLEAPDRSAIPKIILDGLALLDGTFGLAGEFQPLDLGTFQINCDDPQPIIVEGNHVSGNVPCRLHVISGVDGAENPLETSPNATFTATPYAPGKPNSGTAFGPNPESITPGTVTTDTLDGKSKSYTPFTITGIPTADGFLGYEIVSWNWPDDASEYVHTGILQDETTQVENDTPASVITVKFSVRACYQGPDGSVNRNPIVDGVTPTCEVTLGTTGAIIDPALLFRDVLKDTEFEVRDGIVQFAGVDFSKGFNFNTDEFEIVDGQMRVRGVNFSKGFNGFVLDGTEIPQITIAPDGAPLGWIGKDAASGYSGAWFKRVMIGGSDPASAAFFADSSGNVVAKTLLINDAGSPLGWIGAKDGYAGAWFKRVIIGGATVSDTAHQIIADASGNISIPGALIQVSSLPTVPSATTAGSATTATSAATATNATTATTALSAGSMALSSGSRTLSLNTTDWIKMYDSSTGYQTVLQQGYIYTNKVDLAGSEMYIHPLGVKCAYGAGAYFQAYAVPWAAGPSSLVLANGNASIQLVLGGYPGGGGYLSIAGNAVVGPRQAAVTGPAGGTTVDSQARTAINDIIARLQAHGLIS